MSLASVFQRKKSPATRPAGDSAADEGDALRWERVRARRRLIGAVLLLGLGIVGFPWLFDSQPRPLPSDLPLEVARRDSGAVTVAPAPAAVAPPVPAAASRPAPILPPPDAGSEGGAASAPIAAVAASAPSGAVAAAASAAPAALARTTAPPSPPPVAVAKPAAAASAPSKATAPVSAKAGVAAPAASAPRAAPSWAKASEPVAETPGRFVVQVGAFTDPVALRDVRQRVEKLGLKTYTQVIETSAGKRTRVRVGPFATREEADKAGAKLKAAGLPAYMLAL